MQKKSTRKGSTPIKVYCLLEEKTIVKGHADAVGLSMSAYLLRVGMGYEVTGILDHRRVDDLAKVNGDLGRLGGLLKLWLTRDVRTQDFKPATLHALLSKIESTQDELRRIMLQVLRE